MKAIVIGAAGFVGGYLIDELQNNHYNVCATKLPQEKLDANAEILDLDILDFDSVCRMFRNIQPECIFHLAAQSSVKLSWEKPQLTADVNMIGAINVFEAVRQCCPKAKIVVVGSSEEYGAIDYRNSIDETIIPSPTNIYAVTKYAQEILAQIYVKAYRLRIVLTRSFNHIGPKQSTQFVVSDFCSQVAEIEKKHKAPIIYVGNLSASRDFSDVRDIVCAYRILAEKGRDGEVYNIGRGQAVKIADILKSILSKSNVEIKTEIDSWKFRPIDIPLIRADISKIRKLGWEPRIPLEQSIGDILDYYRNLE